MLLILTLSALLIGGIEAGITDLNCTHMVGGTPKYSESAINCNNKISDAACLVIYTTAVEADNDTERDAKCAGNPVVPVLMKHQTVAWRTPSFAKVNRSKILHRNTAGKHADSATMTQLELRVLAVETTQNVPAGFGMDSVRAHSTLMPTKCSTVVVPAVYAKKETNL
nr:unnamed protein product [Haemonchus contortus]